MNKEEYKAYLQSDYWRVFRRIALEQADWECQLCPQSDPKQLEVHHRTYKRLGHEKLKDVIVLCHHCHSKHHDKLPQPAEARVFLPLKDLIEKLLKENQR
jgi:5-methylcytosine-specific restriction endonuclease McrA